MPVPDAIPPILTRITDATAPLGLMVMGHLQDPDTETRAIVLVGADQGFWQVFVTSPEYLDGAPHPVDRWSKRILCGLARAHHGTCVFPSDGPPYAPFIAWATQTGRFWQSPTGMLVHDRAGLMISIRCALMLDTVLPQPAAAQSPCSHCAGRPCTSACPVSALSDTHPYNVPLCKDHIRGVQGADCVGIGCATRLACPISQAFDRPTAQTTFHMRAFRGT